MPLTCILQQQDLMTEAITKALRSTHVHNLIVSNIQEALHRQKDSIKDMIRKALQLVRYPQHPPEDVGTTEMWDVCIVKDIITSVVRNEVPFRRIDDVIMLGINEILQSAQLNNFLMDMIKELLVSGEWDSIIQEIFRNMLDSQHEGRSVAVALAMAVPFRQLDDILLDIFAELVSSGELDDIMVNAISEMLQSGKLDGIISNTIALLENQVRLVINGIAMVDSMNSRTNINSLSTNSMNLIWHYLSKGGAVKKDILGILNDCGMEKWNMVWKMFSVKYFQSRMQCNVYQWAWVHAVSCYFLKYQITKHDQTYTWPLFRITVTVYCIFSFADRC